MYDVHPSMQQLIKEDGQPVQLLNRLTYTNGTLSLSPGTEFKNGSFATQPSPDGRQLWLTPHEGSPISLLTRTPQISSRIRSGDSERLRTVS